jgi:hypothetical protein
MGKEVVMRKDFQVKASDYFNKDLIVSLGIE